MQIYNISNDFLPYLWNTNNKWNSNKSQRNNLKNKEKKHWENEGQKTIRKEEKHQGRMCGVKKKKKGNFLDKSLKITLPMYK